MSEPLRIGLVAEGPTDYEIINAALLTLLQPENTQPQFGGGWGGVLKWCHASSQRHTGPLTQDPTLSLFDLLVSPPVADTCAALELVLLSWLGAATADDKTIRCIPAQSTGAWLASAVLDGMHPLLEDAECNPDLENQLARLPKAQRIKKTVADYRRFAPVVTAQWAKVKAVCSQAERFEQCAREIFF